MILHLSLVSITISALLATAVAGGLKLKISGPESLDDITDLTVRTTLINTGTSPVTLIKDPRSVLSPAKTETFNLFHETGISPTFTGMRVKYSLDRAASNPATIVTLAPGASIDVDHDLAGAYNLTSSGVGTYHISPSTLLHTVDEDGTPLPVHAVLENTHKVAFLSNSRLAVTLPQLAKSGPTDLAKRASFSSCSSTEESEINSAVTGAINYVATSLSYLQAHTSSTTRFTTWFGSFSTSHHTTVVNQYTSLTVSGSYSGWTYDCACEDGDSNTYAYTFPSQYGVIYLCPVFWEVSTTGTDSRAGTLVHESTHFTRTAGTQDYAYGQTACKSLAKSSPSEAIENADSHEYFSENNPALA